jgi:hypothetical protein
VSERTVQRHIEDVSEEEARRYEETFAGGDNSVTRSNRKRRKTK